MKTLILRLALPVLAALGMSSCADTQYVSGPGPGINAGYQAYGTGFVTYSRLPVNYTGNAYYYQNRYYTGGRYETGSYRNNGRNYASRYYHNGRYYYGGTQQNYPAYSRSTLAQDFRYRRTGGTRPSMFIGSAVNTSPMVDTSTNRNADVYTTSSARGPSISLASPWVSRRSYDSDRTSGR